MGIITFKLPHHDKGLPRRLGKKPGGEDHNHPLCPLYNSVICKPQDHRLNPVTGMGYRPLPEGRFTSGQEQQAQST